MAKLHILELEFIPIAPDGTPLWIADVSRIVAQQVVTFSSTTQSASFNAKTSFVRVYSDAKAHLKFDDNPTATNQHIPIAAETPEYFAVSPGSKVAVVTG